MVEGEEDGTLSKPSDHGVPLNGGATPVGTTVKSP